MDASPFSKLSGELRNAIYGLVLYQPGGFHFRRFDNRLICCRPPIETRYYPPHRISRSPHLLALTRVCKEIRKESISLFYGINTFVIKTRVYQQQGTWTPDQHEAYRRDLRACKQWLEKVGWESTAWIQRFIIESGAWQVWHQPEHKNNQWWKKARDMERKFFKLLLQKEAVFVGTYIEYQEEFLASPTIPCRYLPELTFCEASRISVILPTAEKALARKKAEELFATRAMLLQMHQDHDCGLKNELAGLLAGLQTGQDLILKALRD